MFEEGVTCRLPEAVVAIGVFDGVHRGHQALVAHALTEAGSRDIPVVALTFDRDPDQVVSPDEAMPQLLTLEDKCSFLGEAGADIVVVVPFDAHVAGMSPLHFVDEVLLKALAPISVHVGVDFRFGHFAEGDLATLVRLGAERGFEVSGHDLVTAGGAPVTSTRIRGLVASGDVAGAAALLGRAHRVSGRVVHGRGEGVPLLGIPTANISPYRFAALPAQGVYAGRVIVDGGTYLAGISVGIPPTFPDAHDVLEAHLLDFEGELHGSQLVVEFAQRIRDQIAFDSPAQLADRMRADFELVRARSDVQDERATAIHRWPEGRV